MHKQGGQDSCRKNKSSLGNAYQNPFNSTVSIPFTLENSNNLKITVYDALGRHVNTLANAAFPSGVHKIVWHGQNQVGATVGNGLYFVTVSTTTQTFRSKVLLLK